MKTFKKAWNAVTSVLVTLVVIAAVLLVGVRLIGLQTYTVLSGSMEPKYHVGSLIYVRKVESKTLQPGDDITFMLNEDTVATHQIIEVIPDEEEPEVIRFRTKGIANEQPDGGTVHCKNIIGKPVFTIPYLGYLANYIQDPPGRYVAISGAAILLILVFLPDLFSSDPDGDKRSDKRSDKRRQKKLRDSTQKSKETTINNTSI